MIRFACPGCGAVYTVDDAKGGKTGKCPKCQTQFQIPAAEADRPPPLPPPPPLTANVSPPPPPPPAMADPNAPVEIKPCPGCRARLSVSPEDVGADVECPYCRTVYKAMAAALTPPKPSRRGRPDDEDEDDDFDDRPSRRRRRDAEEDEDDRPSRRRSRRDMDDEDEDDRPSRRRRRDEDDDDFDARPRRRRRRRRSSEEGGTGLATASMVLGILSIPAACCCPPLGGLTGISGLVTGVIGMKSEARGQALAGIICSIIGLVIAVLNALAGAAMNLNNPNGFNNNLKFK